LFLFFYFCLSVCLSVYLSVCLSFPALFEEMTNRIVVPTFKRLFDKPSVNRELIIILTFFLPTPRHERRNSKGLFQFLFCVDWKQFLFDTPNILIV
jgi:hypothetical protein